MWNARPDEAQAGIKIAGRNINNLRYADGTTLMTESEEELKSLLMKVKEENEKTGLKLNIQKSKIMASGPFTSWQIDGKTMETVRDFIFGGSEITVDSDCSMKVKDACSLEETQAGIKIAGRNNNNLRYADDTTLWQKAKNQIASWWKWKRRVKKLA